MRPYIFIVGEDVDVTDMEDVYWCLTTRLDPAHNIHVQTDTVMSGFWPWVKPEDRAVRRGSKVYFDATFPPEWDHEYKPQIVDFESAWPADVRDQVFERWAEYGFEDDPRGKR
jgi:3-polyprenyl-4-hydroxybenzoate decarboxylase